MTQGGRSSIHVWEFEKLILWIGLAAFLLPLIFILSTGRSEKKARAHELDRIQRRLAEKEAESQSSVDE
jgi:hypothetical protein